MKIKYKYNICQNGHKTNIQDVMYLKKKKKYIKILTTSLNIWTLPLSPKLPLPL